MESWTWDHFEMHLLLKRARLALTTWPTAEGWRFCAIIGSIYFVTALSIGLISGIMSPSPFPPVGDVIKLMLLSIVIPGAFEEMTFRGLTHPSIVERLRRPRAVLILSTMAFILWHPFNYFVFLRTSEVFQARVFLDPSFLAIVLVLGIACSLMFQKTRSLWPCFAVHYLTVVVWKCWFGGLRFFPI